MAIHIHIFDFRKRIQNKKTTMAYCMNIQKVQILTYNNIML